MSQRPEKAKKKIEIHNLNYRTKHVKFKNVLFYITERTHCSVFQNTNNDAS